MSRRTQQIFAGGLLAAAALWFTYGFALGQGTPAPCTRVSLPVVVNLDDISHVHLIDHERNAINGRAVGELSAHPVSPAPRTLTLERDGAPARRTADLRGIPTRPGFDRDEWPPAFTEEAGLHSDGTSSSVTYIPSSENRSGGSVMGQALRPYCDGQRFIIEAGRP
jgi:hypothetical protein